MFMLHSASMLNLKLLKQPSYLLILAISYETGQFYLVHNNKINARICSLLYIASESSVQRHV